MAEGDVNVKFGGDTSELASSITQVREVLQGLTSPLRAVRQNLGEVAEAFVAAFAIEKLDEWARGMAELGEQVVKNAASVAMSVQDYSLLSNTMEVFGVQGDESARTMERLERNMQLGVQGTGQQAAAFQALGISQSQLRQGMNDMPGFIDLLRERWQAYGDDANKTAAFQDLMGRSFDRLVPYLRQTTEEVDRTKAEVAATGATLSGPMAEGMEQTSEQFHLLGQAIQGVNNTLFEAFKPAIDEIVTSLTHLVEQFNNGIKSGGDLNSTLAKSVDAFDEFIVVGEAIVAVLHTVWDVSGELVDELVTFFTGVGAAAKDAFTGNMFGAADQLKSTYEQMKALDESYQQSFEKTWTDFGQRVHQIFTNIKTDEQGVPTSVNTTGTAPTAAGNPNPESGAPGAKPSMENPGDIMEGWREAQAAASAALQSIRADYALQMAAAKDAYDQQGISAQQERDMEIAATNSMTANTISALQKELAAVGPNVAERIRIEGQIEKAKQDQATKLQQIDRQYYDTVLKLDEQSVNDRIAANNRRLQAEEEEAQGEVSTGQLTQRQKIALDQQYLKENQQVNSQILQDFINTHNLSEQVHAQYVAKLEAMDQQYENKKKQLENQANQAMRAQAQALSTDISSALMSGFDEVLNGTATWAQAMNKIFEDMFERLLAWILQSIVEWTVLQIVSMGSAGGMGGGGGFLGGLMSFDVGAYEIPHDMVAMVHAGEMILPPQVAEMARAGQSSSAASFPATVAATAGASGSGSSASAALTVPITFNVSAVDGASVSNLLKNQGGVIGNIIADQIRNAHAGLMAASNKTAAAG